MILPMPKNLSNGFAISPGIVLDMKRVSLFEAHETLLLTIMTTSNWTMSKAATKTRILDDGLRYQSKAKGSPFNQVVSFNTSTMSCFLCGKHRPRANMTTRRLLGKSQTVCAPSCKAAREADTKLAAADAA
jgi:hypothetical protein